jgi:hypothetical protein
MGTVLVGLGVRQHLVRESISKRCILRNSSDSVLYHLSS